MSDYMQKVDAVAKKVMAWRKIAKNKDSHNGSIGNQVAWVLFAEELSEQEAPRTRNFQGLVVSAVMEIEAQEEADDPKLCI